MKEIVLYSLILLTFDSLGQKIDAINLNAYFCEYAGRFSV
jgi:hypothetical protein